MRLLICTQAVDRKDPILGFFHGWLLEFAKQCERVDVICLREGDHDLPENVRVFTLGKTHGAESLLVDRLRYVVRFLALVFRRSRECEGIFVHMNTEYVILGGWLWKLLGKRIVLWYTHKSVTLSLRIASRIAHTVCTASRESFRLKRKNILVTGHGIDTEFFNVPRKKPGEFLRIVTIGRISRAKGLLALIDALPFLPKRGVPYRCTIVGAPITRGDEAYHRELLERVEFHQIRQFVSFVGAKEGSDIPQILAESDVFVHASETGSLDKAVLEAMAERCIVISSNDAVRPILHGIHHGLAVTDPTPEAFADALQRVNVLDDMARSEIGEKMRAIVVEGHSLNRLVTKILWIFRA